MRPTLAAFALAFLVLAGCAQDRCCWTSRSTEPSPACYKPCLVAEQSANGANAAPTAPAGNDGGSPYITNSQLAPTLGSRMKASALPPTAVAPPAAVPPAAVPPPAAPPAVVPPAVPPPARANPAVIPNSPPVPLREPPTAEPMQPDKLPELPRDTPNRPKLPENSLETDIPPELLNLGQTPEPELAPAIQTTAATAAAMRIPMVPVPPPLTGPVVPEPTMVPQSPVLVRPSSSSKVLTGTLELWRKSWRLRYASIDVEDANGGRVNLVPSPLLDTLQEGQQVRIRGILMPCADRSSAPSFDVQSVEMLNP